MANAEVAAGLLRGPSDDADDIPCRIAPHSLDSTQKVQGAIKGRTNGSEKNSEQRTDKNRTNNDKIPINSPGNNGGCGSLSVPGMDGSGKG